MYLRDGSAQTIFTCCHTEIEVADRTFYLTQSQYTDTGPTSPSADPITPGPWQGSHWSANFSVTGMTRPRKNPGASGIRTRDLPALVADALPLGQRGGLGFLKMIKKMVTRRTDGVEKQSRHIRTQGSEPLTMRPAEKKQDQNMLDERTN